MPSVTIRTVSGHTVSGQTISGQTGSAKKGAAKSATIELDAHLFGVQPNVPVMHQVVTAQLAHRRAGTQSTKTRAEVRGGGRKPFKQKGTGNARQGSIRAPHFSGGGVALGPKPRKYSQKTPKKMIKLALRSALSDRANEGKVLVIDSWGIDTPSTKTAAAAISTLGLTGSVLVVHGRDDIAMIKSFRNLQNVQLIEVGELNAYDVLCNETIVFTKDNLPTGTPIEQAARGESEADDEPAAQHGPGSHAPLEDGSAPEGFDIKGNAQSNLYHTPSSRYYKATVAEVWFSTEEAAEAAGFSKPAAQAAVEDDDTETATTEDHTETGDES